MAAQAGIDSTIEASTDDGSGDAYEDIGGADTVSFPRSRVELDATSFSDDAFKRIVGIKDTSMTISGKYDNSDTGQSKLDAALESGDDLYLQFKPDGTNGYKAAFKIQSFDISTSHDGVVEFTCNAVGNDSSGWSSV